MEYQTCLSSQPSLSYWSKSKHFSNPYCVEWKKKRSLFPFHHSVPMSHIFGSWVSTLSSSFCLIQSPHNGRGPHFSLLPYLGKFLQWQSNVLKPGDGSRHVWWAPVCPFALPNAVPSHKPCFIWYTEGIKAMEQATSLQILNELQILEGALQMRQKINRRWDSFMVRVNEFHLCLAT